MQGRKNLQTYISQKCFFDNFVLIRDYGSANKQKGEVMKLLRTVTLQNAPGWLLLNFKTMN